MKKGEGLLQDGTTFIFLKFWNCVRYLEYYFPGLIILRSRLFPVPERLFSNGCLFYSADRPMVHWWFWVWSLDQSASPGNLLELKNLRTHLRLTESQTLRVGYRGVSMNSLGDPKCLLTLDAGFTICFGAEKSRFVKSVVLTAQRPPGLADCPSTPICPPSSLLSFACVLQSTALNHLFQELFPLVGKHNRLMHTRTVFRGGRAEVEVLPLWLIPQASCFSLYSSIS